MTAMMQYHGRDVPEDHFFFLKHADKVINSKCDFTSDKDVREARCCLGHVRQLRCYSNGKHAPRAYA